VLSCFGDDVLKARQEYVSFVHQGMKWGESIWDDLKKQIYLGSDEFVNEMQELSLKDQGLDDIPREQVSGVKRKMEQFLSYSNKREGITKGYLEGIILLKGRPGFRS